MPYRTLLIYKTLMHIKMGELSMKESEVFRLSLEISKSEVHFRPIAIVDPCRYKNHSICRQIRALCP